MTVNVYRDWTGKDFDSFEFREGLSIKDCVNGIDWKNAVILCNGNRVNENYILKENDCVAIRSAPGVQALIATAIIVGATLLAEGISYAATGKGLFANLVEWLTPSVDTPKQSQQEQIPALKGAKNQNIQGKPVPLIIGQTRLTPYKVGNGYHSISGVDGEKQRFHCLYCLGYNDISAGMFKFGETDFAANGMSESYVNGEYQLTIGNGNKKNALLSDRSEFNSKTPFYNANPSLEIRNVGEIGIYPQKVVEETIGKQIINATGEKLKFTRVSACHAQKIEIEIGLNSLLAYTVNGLEALCFVCIGLGISFDGGNTFEPFGQITDSTSYTTVELDPQDQAQGITGSLGASFIFRAKNKQMRFVATRTITQQEARLAENNADGYVWLRIEKEDADSTDSKILNKAYLAYIRTWCYDKEKSFEYSNGSWEPIGNALVPQSPIIQKIRDKTTRVAVELDATDNVVGELDEFNCMAVANCRTWDSQNEQWSVEKAPTANPAANALNIMQSDMLGEFKYDDSKIDLAAFGELYEFCEDANNERGCKFTVGTALVTKKKISEVLDQIFNQARAYRICSGRKYSVFIDKPISTPVCVLNNSNILVDGASNSKEFRELPDGFKIKFVNKNLGYDEDEGYVMFNQNKSYDAPTAVIEAIEMPFVTDPKQVSKNAWFEYGKRLLRPETWRRTVTTEANLIEIGSLVELRDDTIQVGLGDGWIESVVVESGMVVGFKISTKINISDLTKEYGAKIVHATDSALPDIRVRKLHIYQAAYTDYYALETPVLASDSTAPAEGDLVTIGEYEKETISAICLNKKDKGDGKFELTLLPYDANIYTIDADAKVEFDPKISGVQTDVFAVDTTEYVKREDLVRNMAQIVGGTLDEVGNPDTPAIAECSAERDGIRIALADFSASGLNNTVTKVEWQVAKNQSAVPDENTEWTNMADTAGLSTIYQFDRATDGYPEAEAVSGWDGLTYLNDVSSKWYFRARVTNAYGKSSEWSEPSTVNCDNYGTWLVGLPQLVTDRVSGRTATLVFDQRTQANSRAPLYGDVYYKLEIRREDDLSGFYFNPAETEDPYEDEMNYKAGGSEAVPSSTPSTPSQSQMPEWLLLGKKTSHAFTQTLPLIGQNDKMYQYEWYYEGPTSGPNARVDSFGNPRKEGAGVAYSETNPSGDWQAVTSVYGNPRESGEDKWKVPGYFLDGDGRVHGALGETGSDSYTTDIFRDGDEIYELIKENGTDYSKAFHNGVFAEIENGEFTLGGWNWVIEQDGVRKDTETSASDRDIFSATKTLSYNLVDGFDPADTVYQYKVRAFNVWNGEVVHWNGAETYTIAALATSAKDLVEGAITHNKLADGAVWVDNLAAGSITAEKMAVRDLMAITGVFGKIQNNIIETEAHNKWNLETGEFLVGNEYAVIDPDSDDAEYIKFTPANPLVPGSVGNLAIKIANFIVKAITSVIRGILVVTNKSGTANNLLVANPELTQKTTESPAKTETVPALTARINGFLEVNASKIQTPDPYYKTAGGIIECEREINCRDGIIRGYRVGAEYEFIMGKSIVSDLFKVEKKYTNTQFYYSGQSADSIWTYLSNKNAGWVTYTGDTPSFASKTVDGLYKNNRFAYLGRKSVVESGQSVQYLILYDVFKREVYRDNDGTNTYTLTSQMSINVDPTLRIKFANLPTSSTGLDSGELWNDNGTLRIV